MPARPPETFFYNNDENAQLWRDVSRLYDYFVGGDNKRIWRFETVLRDVLVELGDVENSQAKKVD